MFRNCVSDSLLHAIYLAEDRAKKKNESRLAVLLCYYKGALVQAVCVGLAQPLLWSLHSVGFRPVF